MNSDTLIRSYIPSDLQAIQKIHERNGIDYRLPNLNRFPVMKVLVRPYLLVLASVVMLRF